ncbi:MAG TPA: CYTH domain-containing protein [Lentimicrobium sp.]|nr:CYTH domain-containing protein [Lentimicrobium sp.]
MAIEIERKYLVKGDFMEESSESSRITQGYLSSNPDRTVRVRLKGNKAYLTIKGAAHNQMSRYEWEKEIEADEARELLKLCEPGIIDKTRYVVHFRGHLFEVDEFHGENQGLILAEIELKSENEIFIKPDWLGKEVTGDPRYYNAMLSKSPFSEWQRRKD